MRQTDLSQTDILIMRPSGPHGLKSNSGNKPMNKTPVAEFFDMAANDENHAVVAASLQHSPVNIYEDNVLPKHNLIVRSTFINIEGDSDVGELSQYAASAPDLSIPVPAAPMSPPREAGAAIKIQACVRRHLARKAANLRRSLSSLHEQLT